jgi:hypothetical protein
VRASVGGWSVMSLDRARSLTVAQVAMVCEVEQATVRCWINRGNLARNKRGRIDARGSWCAMGNRWAGRCVRPSTTLLSACEACTTPRR